MKKKPAHIVIIILLAYTASNFARTKRQQQNHAPVVKIITPKSNSNFIAGSQVNYSITVADKEDGDSKFDEINVKQVLLYIKYVSDESKLNTLLNAAVENDEPGLAAIRMSNCFNCHVFDSKVIGPSFNDINKRYNPTAENIALLEKRIREGSAGVWGKEAMPSHPELNKEQIQSMVKWITHHASAIDEDYYIGTEVAFKLPNKAGTYLLIANYLDHGLKEGDGKNLKGQDMVVIRSK